MSNIFQVNLLAVSDVPLWVWVIAAVAAVGIVVAVTLIAVGKKKKNAAPQTAQAADEAVTAEAVEEQAEAAVAAEAIQASEPAPEAIQASEPAQVAEPEPEATQASEPAPAEAISFADDEAQALEEEVEAEETTIKFVDGFGIVVRYNKSFKARLIQSSNEVKGYYSELKNALLSYKKVKSRISWNYDSFNAGRNKIAKFNVRGRTLKLYLALNPDDYADTKYKVERSERKRYEEVPCLYKITNPRRVKYAAELIAAVAEKFSLAQGEEHSENFYLPYETTEALIKKELIKELVSETAYNEYMRRKNQAEVDKIHREFVSAAEVNAIISDEIAVSLVEDVRTPVNPAKPGAGDSAHSGKKGIINIDVLSQNFEANDRVTLEAIKEKGLVAKNIGYVKVLARGVLNKPLEVELQDYSIEAVKMILLTGGKVKRT